MSAFDSGGDLQWPLHQPMCNDNHRHRSFSVNANPGKYQRKSMKTTSSVTGKSFKSVPMSVGNQSFEENGGNAVLLSNQERKKTS